MTRLLLFLLLLPAFCVGQGHPVRISVRAGREVLPYAYLYVNGMIRGAADSTGVALLDTRQIQHGDTITASYIGKKSAFVVYTGAPAYTVEFSPERMLAPVIVIPTDNYKDFFGKQIRILNFPRFYQELKADFRILDSERGKTTSGSVTAASVYIAAGKYSFEQELTLKTDTTSVSATVENLAYYLHKATLYVDFYRHRYLNEGVRVVDEGPCENGLQTYSILRSYDAELQNTQLRVFVDPYTRIVREAEILTVYPHRTESIWARYQTQGNILFPQNIQVKIYRKPLSDKPGVEYILDNITLSAPVFKKYKARQKELYQAFKADERAKRNTLK